MANQTIRDYITESSKQNLSPDAIRSGFKETFNQNLDDYQDKLDTPLDQLAAPKPKAPAIPTEPKTPALGIAPETKSAFATVREALTKPESIAALAPAAGRAIGGLPGELAGMGLGLLAAGKKPEVPAMPRVRMPAAPVAEAPKPAEPVAEAPKPGFFAQRGLQYKPLPELAPEEGPVLQQRKVSEEGLLKRTARFALPEFVEKPLLGEEAMRPMKEGEVDRDKEGFYTNLARGLLPRAVPVWPGVEVKIEEPLLGPEPYDKEKFEQELAASRGEMKWPTPAALVKRFGGGLEKAAPMLMGETKVSRDIEERGPLAFGLKTLTEKDMAPDPFAAKMAEALPEFVPSAKKEEGPKRGAGRLAFDPFQYLTVDPFEPRPSDPDKAEAWDQIQSSPELLKEAKKHWRMIRARREAEGVPLTSEGLPAVSWKGFKEKQKPIYEQVGKEREEAEPYNLITLPFQVATNLGADLTNTLTGMMEIISEAVGPALTPETPEVVQAREMLKEAKQSGDPKLISEAEDDYDTAQQRAIGGKTGAGLAGLPGQVAALATGLADPNMKNTLVTKPFSTWVMLFEPLRASGKWFDAHIAGKPLLEQKFNNARATIYNAAVDTAKTVVPDFVGRTGKKAKNILVQFIADSVMVGNKAMSEIMDNIVNGKKGALDQLRERVQRIYNRGEVELKDVDPDTLQEVDVWMQSEEKVGEVEAATRKAEAARAKAEKFASAKKMVTATAEQLAELNREQVALQRAAENVEKQIVQAAGSADEARLQIKLKELQVEQDRLARREETLRKQSVQRSKAKAAAESAVEIAVPFVERMAEEAPGVKREGRKVSRQFMSQMAEMERKESLADEALRRGLTADDVMRQREDAIIDRLGERAYEKAGQAAAAGIGLAERAKAMQPVVVALQEARRAAAAQAPTVAGAERAARAAEARVAEAAARPEVYVGQTYIPKTAIPAELKGMYTPEEIQELNNTVIKRAKENPTEENLRAGRAAVQELKILEDAQTRKKVRVSDYRTDVDRARQAVINAHERVQASDANLADMQRRAKSAQSTITADQLDAAELENQQIRMAAEDARNNLQKSELAYQLIRDVKLPNKVPELAGDIEFAAGSEIEQALHAVPEKYWQIIEGLVDEAGELKKRAGAEGANLDVPVSDVVADQIGVPRGSSLYTAARRFAEHLTNLNVKADGQPGVVPYMREFLLEQGITRGVDSAAGWLAKEIEAQQAMTGLVEPKFGYVRRPVATVEVGEIKPSGQIDWRPKAAEQAYAESLQPGDQATGTKKEMRKALREMQEMITEPETPKSIKTNNAEFDKLLDEYAQKVVELGYGLRTPAFGGEPGEFLNAKDLADRKILTAERIKQRMLEVLTGDTMQPLLHSEEFQTHVWKEARKRLQSQGLKGSALDEAVAQIKQYVMEPERLSYHSKNRFPELKYKGVDILTRDDFIKATDEIDPRIMNKARANAFNYIAGRQSAAAQTFGLLHSINTELNRFRKDASGEWLVDPQTGRTPVTAADYAKQVADGVINKNQTPPLIMPYEGVQIANQLEKIAQEPRWTPEQQTRILELAKDMREAVPAKVLEDVVKGIYSQVFEGTDAAPPDFNNLYMPPAVLRAMKSHFASMGDVLKISDIWQSIEAIAQYTKKSVVPLNVRALVNNNLSNSLLQIMTRGTVGFIPNLFTESYKLKKYLDGDHKGMSPQDLQMYEALASRQSLFRTEFRNLYGENPAWRALKKNIGLLRRVEAAMQSGRYDWTTPFMKYKEFRDFLTEYYTKAGDAPFRLEEMVHVFKNFYNKIKSMEGDTSAEIRVSKYGELKLTKDPATGKYLVTDLAGREEPKLIDLDSPEMSRILAAAADVLQEEKFLNPQRLGIWFKALQSSRMSPISGIFSWAAGALDVPFIKKGLVSKMMEGPASLKTNSPAILREQAGEFTSWWLKRALMVNAAQAASMDRRQAEDAGRSVAFNPTIQSMILGPGGDPDYISIRDTVPLNFAAPTITAMNILSNVYNWTRFSPLMADANFLAQAANADIDWAAKTPQEMEQLKRTNPEIYEHGEQMRKLAVEDPDAYRKRALLKRDFVKYGKGEISNAGQFLQMVGLAGSPFTRWLIEATHEGMTAENMRKQLFSLVFGATPYSMIDVGLALGGQAGVKPMERWSTYGTTMGKSGEREDASSLRDWAIMQLLGLGWKRVFYGGDDVEPDDPRGYPRTKAYLISAKKKMNDSVVGALRRMARKPLPANATDEQVAESADQLETYEWFKEGLDRAYEKLMDALEEQGQKINRPIPAKR